jgi:hypothetical protein
MDLVISFKICLSLTYPSGLSKPGVSINVALPTEPISVSFVTALKNY